MKVSFYLVNEINKISFREFENLEPMLLENSLEQVLIIDKGYEIFEIYKTYKILALDIKSRSVSERLMIATAKKLLEIIDKKIKQLKEELENDKK